MTTALLSHSATQNVGHIRQCSLHSSSTNPNRPSAALTQTYHLPAFAGTSRTKPCSTPRISELLNRNSVLRGSFSGTFLSRHLRGTISPGGRRKPKHVECKDEGTLSSKSAYPPSAEKDSISLGQNEIVSKSPRSRSPGSKSKKPEVGDGTVDSAPDKSKYIWRPKDTNLSAKLEPASVAPSEAPPTPVAAMENATEETGVSFPGGSNHAILPDPDPTRQIILHPQSVRVPYGDREILIETGKMGRLANGAVTVSDGDTMIYATACASDEPSEPSDFVPLQVIYQERYSAAGRTAGGFIKREGRPRENEVLISRLIDRPIRPMVDKSFNYETQLLAWVLSYDGSHQPDVLAITAASAALAISDIPLSKPVAGVRVGLIDGELQINPSHAAMKHSRLDMILAGTADAVLMIEGYCSLLPEEELLRAVEVGQEAVAKICICLDKWARQVGKPKLAGTSAEPPPGLLKKTRAVLGNDLEASLRLRSKKDRRAAGHVLEQRLLAALTHQGQSEAAKAAALMNEDQRIDDKVDDDEMEEEEAAAVEDEEVAEGAEGEVPVYPKTPTISAQVAYEVAEVKHAYKELTSEAMRRLIVQEGMRSDGRRPDEIRPIEAICGLLPCTHGSALFTRGETQALAVATLGGDDMSQRMDSMTAGTQEVKRFYLQYSFPPSSVGETGRVGAASRREIGHGQLAERALEPVLPPADKFPYTIRLESTITESNGSSSMASVCGGWLAMRDAGVPLTEPVAGVAMGLVLDTHPYGGSGEPLILSDILGSEDALGDMDFKVAGSETGVTAFQMDIKVEGITVAVMEKALLQARTGRHRILAEMAKAYPPPKCQLSPLAPRIHMMKVASDKVAMLIGTGGKTIRGIVDQCGVEAVDVQDDGTVRIVSLTQQGLDLAVARIQGMFMVPEIGKIYRGCKVKSVLLFGCFVEIAPGKEGLVHISELSTARLATVDEFVKEGDILDVKLLEINAKGQLRLSHKAVLLEQQREVQSSVVLAAVAQEE